MSHRIAQLLRIELQRLTPELSSMGLNPKQLSSFGLNPYLLSSRLSPELSSVSLMR